MGYPAQDLSLLIQLYQDGLSMNKIAEDPELMKTILAGIVNSRSRAWKVYKIIETLIKQGVLQRRNNTVEYNVSMLEPNKTEDDTYHKYLDKYEKLIGGYRKRSKQVEKDRLGKYSAALIADPHIPDERMDLIAEVAERHKKEDCYVLGDVNDFEHFSQFAPSNLIGMNLRDLLIRTDSFFEFLSKNFRQVYVILGNHDNRLSRKVAKCLGSDYAWICEQFLVFAYQQRHGVQIVQNIVKKHNGEPIEGLTTWCQVGDCLMTHAELQGKPVAKSVEKTHDFFTAWKSHIGLDPFNVVIQAHSHRVSYFKHPMTGVHCYELGAMCDSPTYALKTFKFNPIQNGYYHLVQKDGRTMINESRLYVWD